MVTVLFVISFVGIVYLLTVKVYEIKRGTVTRMTKVLSRYDNAVTEHLVAIKGYYQSNTGKVSTFVESGILVKSKDVTARLKNATSQAYRSVLPNVRGKRVFKSDKQASDFLKRISNHKEQNSGGRIEDNVINNERPTTDH